MKFINENIYQVKLNCVDKNKWLSNNPPKKFKCQSCNNLYSELNGNIAIMTIKNKPYVHICHDCGMFYISKGAIDVEDNQIKNKIEKEKIILEIRKLNTYDEKSLQNKSLEELKTLLEGQKVIKEKEDRIASIELTEDDLFIEEYLIKEYNVIRDEKYLKCEEQIGDFFEDGFREYFDCGQGYFQDESIVIAKIAQKFYEVTLKAEIGSSKQDIGDRLYWVEGVKLISWKEIPKPLPKKRTEYKIDINVTEEQKIKLDKLIKSFNL